MRASEFLADLVRRLESVDLEYALVGSIATMSYGEPRATLDIDVVAAMDASGLEDLKKLFPAPDFYLSLDAAREAVPSQAQFNVIHPASGMKVDFFVAGDAVEASHIRRRLRRLILPDVEAWCSPPEELIVKKLSYYGKGASDKHLRDIASMLRISPKEIDVERVRGLAGEELLGRERCSRSLPAPSRAWSYLLWPVGRSTSQLMLRHSQRFAPQTRSGMQQN